MLSELPLTGVTPEDLEKEIETLQQQVETVALIFDDSSTIIIDSPTSSRTLLSECLDLSLRLLPDLCSSIEDSTTTLQMVENIMNRPAENTINLKDRIKNAEKDCQVFLLMNRNAEAVLNTLDQLTYEFHSSMSKQDVLKGADFFSDADIQTVVEELEKISDFCDEEKSHQRLKAVFFLQEYRQVLLNLLKSVIKERLVITLSDLFRDMAEQRTSVSKSFKSTLRSRVNHHRILQKFSPLMKIVYKTDHSEHSRIKENYAMTMGKAYQTELENFLDKISSELEDMKIGNAYPVKDDRFFTLHQFQCLFKQCPLICGSQNIIPPGMYKLVKFQKYFQGMLEAICEAVRQDIDFLVPFFSLQSLLEGNCEESEEQKKSFSVTSRTTVSGENVVSKDIPEHFQRFLCLLGMADFTDKLKKFTSQFNKLGFYFDLLIFGKLRVATSAFQCMANRKEWKEIFRVGSAERYCLRSSRRRIKVLADAPVKAAIREDFCSILPGVNEFRKFVVICEGILKNCTQCKRTRRSVYEQRLSFVNSRLEETIRENPQIQQKLVLKMINYFHLLETTDLPVELSFGTEKGIIHEKLEAAVILYLNGSLKLPLLKLRAFCENVAAAIKTEIDLEKFRQRRGCSESDLKKTVAESSKLVVKEELQKCQVKIDADFSTHFRLKEHLWQKIEQRTMSCFQAFISLLHSHYPDVEVVCEIDLDFLVESFLTISSFQARSKRLQLDDFEEYVALTDTEPKPMFISDWQVT